MDRNKRPRAAMNYDEISYDDDPAPEHNKRPRTDKKSQQSSQARVDPTYGQRSAFPGLDSYSAYTAADDDDLEYGDDIEALQYLQAVRHEAAGIPTLLVAPRPVQHVGESPDSSVFEGETVDDSRGYYADGAYVGNITPIDDSASESQEAQAAYFESLMHRFRKLHDQLSTTPPQIVIDGLSSNHPSHMSNSREDMRSWRWRLFNTDPQPAQLAIMEKSTVFKLLRLILTNNGALGGKNLISSRLSRWIWGLLAKLPVCGELMSEEVGLIREIGKRAVWLGVEMRGVDIRELYREDAMGDDDNEVVVDYELLDDDKDAEPESIADETRIIGPVLPSADDTAMRADRAGEESAEAEPGVPTPVVFSCRADAILAQQTTNGTTEVIEELEQGEFTDAEASDRIAALKERLLASLEEERESSASVEEVDATAQEAQKEWDHQSALENAKITVDMIITIAGEIYGQRDLLEFRSEWS